MRPYLIGIAGPSGAGKSFLAEHLVRALGSAVILPMDAYYPDLSHVPPCRRASVNFDDPAILDTTLLFDQVTRSANGEAIAQPVYDFAHHTRTSQTITVESREFVIVEGLFTLHWPELRRLLQTRVYVELGDSLCLERRTARDVRDRGRTPEYVQQQFETAVRPMAQRYVAPSAQFADVRVYGASQIEHEVAAVLSHISATRKTES
jgi:uridine kinase